MNNFNKIFPLPDQLSDARGTQSWEEIENKLHTSLPLDYKAFIDSYGTGIIMGMVWVYNPFSTNKYLNIFQKHAFHQERLAYEKKTENLRVPYSAFPEEGGILCLGGSENGDSIFWETKGAPDEWHIVISDFRSDEYETYPLDLSNFLLQLASGEIQSEILPGYVLDKTQMFIPLDELDI